MELEWMGRYREIIGKIMRHGNLYTRAYAYKYTDDSGVVISTPEWQTLECILEYEDEYYNMSVLADRIGIPQSNFSKYVKTLIDMGLVERYKRDDNYKDIILKLSSKGRELYQIRSSAIAAEWEDVFEVLNGCSEEQLAVFSQFVTKLTESFEPNKTKPAKLIKV